MMVYHSLRNVQFNKETHSGKIELLIRLFIFAVWFAMAAIPTQTFNLFCKLLHMKLYIDINGRAMLVHISGMLILVYRKSMDYTAVSLYGNHHHAIPTHIYTISI